MTLLRKLLMVMIVISMFSKSQIVFVKFVNGLLGKLLLYFILFFFCGFLNLQTWNHKRKEMRKMPFGDCGFYFCVLTLTVNGSRSTICELIPHTRCVTFIKPMVPQSHTHLCLCTWCHWTAKIVQIPDIYLWIICSRCKKITLKEEKLKRLIMSATVPRKKSPSV